MEHPVILVAEDESVIGIDLCDTVEEAGYIVEGPHPDISSAMLACQKKRPDLAILDVRLLDGPLYPLAEQLLREDVPVIFHSGHISPDDISTRFPKSKSLTKPCPPGQMLETVAEALAQ